MPALVATASLELGIDIGEVDLVCQIGSPRSIAAFLQRVGRSGHAVGGTPKGRLFPLSRDELVECAALLDSVARGELDRLSLPERPLDVLAQQIVAEVAAQEWSEEALFALFRRSFPYRELPREDFAEIVGMLAEGFSTRRGRRGALIHHDAVNGMLRGRRGARITALTSGGTIPDTAEYQVLLEPENQVIGTVTEDFAVESLAGDVFQLGNAAYRIRRVERGTLRVEDAEGQPPNIPFWLGEAPGRSNELSQAVSRLRARWTLACENYQNPLPPTLPRLRGEGRVSRACLKLPDGPPHPCSPRMGERELCEWLAARPGIGEAAARQMAEYLAAGHAALGMIADARHDHSGAVFRRSRRHAAGRAFPLWQPAEPRLGAGAAQAVLPQVQFRTAGGGYRGQYRAVADHGAQFRSGRRSRAICTRPPCATCWSRRCSTRRCS